MAKLINTTEALILGSLHSGRKSGAQIIDIARRIEGLWTCTRSQVYRDLHSLEKLGAIVPTEDKGLYEVTTLGRGLYAEWTASGTFKDHIRSTWVLRLALTEHDGTNRKAVCSAAAQAYEGARQRYTEEDSGGKHETADRITETLGYSAEIMHAFFVNEGARSN